MSKSSWQSMLVAVRDPDAPEQMAIRTGARLADAAGARLTLFNAYSLPFPPLTPAPASPATVLGGLKRQRSAALRRHAKRLRSAGLRVTCEAAWDFPPAHAIVRAALAMRADLVIAESRRRSRLARWALSNTDWELIRECPCPLWLAKRERHGRKPLVLAAVDPAHAYAKPSGLDARLLTAATEAARCLNGRVAMIHVMDVRRLQPPAFLRGLPRQPLRPPPEMRAHAETALRRLATRHGVAAEDTLLEQGVPAEQLVAAAKRLNAAVLVMGAISRSARKGVYIGDTAELVLDAVECDLLVVKPRGFRTTVSRKRPRLPSWT